MSGLKKDSFERQPFYGSKVPPNVAAMKKQVMKVDRNTFQKLTRIAISSIEGKPVVPSMFESLADSTVSLQSLHIVYAGVHKVLQLAFRCSSFSISKESFTQDLRQIGIPKEFVEDLSAAAFGSRKQYLERIITDSKPKYNKVVDIKWRIDVAISTTSLNRVLEPAISVQLTLNDGSTKKFEMPVNKFQELRYNVATVLKHMQELEKRSVLRIED